MVEPVLLAATHQGSTGIVGNLIYIVGIGVGVGDRAIILPGVQHDKVNERTELEVSPDTKVVIHLNLSAPVSYCGGKGVAVRS
jgi:hypothetical protein